MTRKKVSNGIELTPSSGLEYKKEKKNQTKLMYLVKNLNNVHLLCLTFFCLYSRPSNICSTEVLNFDRLASAAFREFGGIYGVMNELERLKNTVESVRNVLLDAEDKQEQNHAVKNWIRRLKDVLNFADNLLDEFVIEDLRHKADVRQKNKVTKVFYSLSPNRIAFRYKMAHEIEKIRKIFNDIVDEMSKLNLSQNVVVVMQTGGVRRETSSFVLESDIIGRENNKKEIINLLRQHHRDRNVSLIAIVGIGGLGKTALAQLVYNDKEVENIFEKKIWVCL